MTNSERDILVAERVMGWKWSMRPTNANSWKRTILPPHLIGRYTPLWDGRKCVIDMQYKGWLKPYINYFKPSTDLVAALQVKDHMETEHGFSCDIKYSSYLMSPWRVTFRRGSFEVSSQGMTLKAVIIGAVLSDELVGVL